MPSPRSTLAGITVHGGCSSVCLRSGHPRCRIPVLQPLAPAVPTERGWLRPERALVYNSPHLLLHDAASTRPGRTIAAAELAGFEKTARRLLAITAPYPWATPEPLEWISPEQLAFTTSNDQQLAALCSLDDALIQAETLALEEEQGASFLVFSRC
jgi:hypothetical protein